MTDFFQNVSDIMPQFFDICSQLLQRAAEMFQYAFQWLKDNPTGVGQVYSAIVRWVMPVLALIILLSVLRDMLRVKNPEEVWGSLVSEQLGKFPITNWECTVGRARHCDVRINFPTVSRTQCALIRQEDGSWRIHSLSEKSKILCNKEVVDDFEVMNEGDTLEFGGVQLTFEEISEEEKEQQQENRLNQSRPMPPWTSFAALTLFQVLTAIQLIITRPDYSETIMLCYAALCGLMWGYTLMSWVAGATGFEPEILAFFACTLNLAVTASAAPDTLVKQTVAITLGWLVFLVMGWYLRDLRRVVRTRHIMAGLTVGLLLINVVFGSVINGAQNWISIAGISVQPSELAKVCFIFAGAATLDRLFVKRNLWGFMLLSGFCLAALAFMSDLGTATIFFVVFLVIAFLRSGDFATLSLICGGAAGFGGLMISFKPYIAARFAVWGHAWENASTTGYQQVRTMSASASGGLIGVGSGNGWLHHVAAADTDLVFGMLCEEWGLIIALLAVAIIVVLSIFAVRVAQNGRSSYYTIAACAATSLLVFQTMLNVFGSVDILPLTGVTFPFVSCGGSSMIASWGLLSFLKAADTRQGASFAVRKMHALDKRKIKYRQKKNEEYEAMCARDTQEIPIAGQVEYAVNDDEQEVKNKQIEDFLRRFNKSEETSKQDEIEDFLKKFEELEEER
ncbi:FtsW/RodA/SpoVE family cell cycle protein [Clostridium aminobutyricum]|uniref:FtsW/RodA/SpoVE family cell cycle protein n=1 Tax=Clostridium aminobutyricum TaxID=33953 RepID=A0A939DAW6_CLOAM|nr:FtsW/RodA/SpoVE family cell cycle protein [Clostridium aminobutyricum]MBN7774360.1 FtsW/RodA/SpoVE family cell cycle protein [Clostridium aminobutyricum]